MRRLGEGDGNSPLGTTSGQPPPAWCWCWPGSEVQLLCKTPQPLGFLSESVLLLSGHVSATFSVAFHAFPQRLGCCFCWSSVRSWYS